MAVMLNDILHLTKEQIDNSRIELNMTAGRYGEAFITRWLELPAEAKESGISDCSYWGWYSSKENGPVRNFRPGQWVFSFAKMSYDEWMFISAAEIIDIPENSRANVRILEQYKNLFGRLIVKHYKGQARERYVFKMANRIDDCEIKELLPCIYSGEKFEGYDNVYLPFHKLKQVFTGEIMPTYYEALKKITGVYCLTDTHTGKLYIGSATGEGGVAQRWGNYLDSKHGGNVKLIELYKKEGAEYFEKYFTYTLLEYFGLSYDPEAVKQREQHWKKCFDTPAEGLTEVRHELQHKKLHRTGRRKDRHWRCA